MDLKQELKKWLGVPENWDKYDYQTQRYSFDDVQEVLEDIVKKLTIPVVSSRRELLIAFANELQNIGFNEMDDVEKIVDVWIKSN